MRDRPTNTKEDHRRARELRNNASPYERKLWTAIKQMAATQPLKFRRQQPIHPYIADFACIKARLLIELDGDSHDSRLAYDKARDDDLRSRGFHIFRFANQDVADNLENIVMTIFDEARRLVGPTADRSLSDISPE